MKNLELKVKLEDNYSTNNIDKYYVDTLKQSDQYFNCEKGRLKLRIENRNDKITSEGIYYLRSNTFDSKESVYELYNIENPEMFMKVFGNGLTTELEIIKTRKLFLYKNARIHVDNVKELGNFLEIEVVIKTEEEDKNSDLIMKEVIDICNINNYEKVDCGYRELLIKHNNRYKTLEYYKNTNKVFWIVNKDIDKYFFANDIVPCIFIEIRNNKMLILQFDENIKFNEYKYTVWRKFIGNKYNIYVDVLLIFQDKLINLKGEEIKFEDLERSNVIINKEYLAKFDVQ